MRARPTLVSLLLVLAACGGGPGSNGDDGRAGGTAPLPTTEASTGAAPPSAAPDTVGTAVTTSPAPRPGAAARRSPTTSASTSAAPTTVRTQQARIYATGAAPGKYVYDVNGSASSGLDPTERPANGRSVLTVDPRRGDDQRWATVSDLSSRPPSEQVLRFLPSGVRLVRLRVGGGFAEFAPSPPVLAAPTPPAGAPWSWSIRSTDGATSLAASFRYRGTETVTVGGQAVPSYVIEGQLRFSGAIVGTVTVTRWVSLAHSLDVKSHEVDDFSVPMRSRGDLTFVLQSLTPS